MSSPRCPVRTVSTPCANPLCPAVLRGLQTYVVNAWVPPIEQLLEQAAWRAGRCPVCSKAHRHAERQGAT